MKSFKEMVQPVEEAMGGKRHFQFKGTDEIGDFWVVLKADKISVLEDILFDADVFDMILQKDGGLKIHEIVGLYKSKAKATKIAKNELAGAGAGK